MLKMVWICRNFRFHFGILAGVRKPLSSSCLKTSRGSAKEFPPCSCDQVEYGVSLTEVNLKHPAVLRVRHFRVRYILWCNPVCYSFTLGIACNFAKPFRNALKIANSDETLLNLETNIKHFFSVPVNSWESLWSLYLQYLREVMLLPLLQGMVVPWNPTTRKFFKVLPRASPQSLM